MWGVINGEATAVTAATAILVFALGEFFRRRLASQQYRWDKIAPQYETLLRHLRKVTTNISDDETGEVEELLAEETVRVMGEFGDQLLLWASPGVIKAWAAMRRLAADGQPSTPDSIRAYGKLLLAIRREFGHSDWNLSEADLFRVIFNDEVAMLIAAQQMTTPSQDDEA